MFWEDIKPHMTPGLEAAVAQAYDVFGRYRLSAPLIYCDCPVCMAPEAARELARQPLNKISANLLAEYTNSAHGMDRDGTERQFKYFLPRYLDLIAHCDPPSHLGLETCLTRLEGYRGAWPEMEVGVIDAFFDAFLSASLNQLDLAEWPAGFSLAFDMGEVLGMIVCAGGDLDRALEVFDRGPDPEAAVHMAGLRAEVSWRRGAPTYENAHLDDYPDAARKIGAWLGRERLVDRIIKAHDTLNDPQYEDVFNAGL